MNISRTFSKAVAIAAVSVSTFGFASVANAQDTGDGFQPSSMCSKPEPAPGNFHLPTLREGHYGMSVELLQIKLGISADGCFGPGTARTVKTYQTCKGLVVDGIVGKQTWNALERDPSRTSNCVAAPKATTSTTSSANGSAPEACRQLTCVVIYQRYNLVRLYNGNGNVIAEAGMIDNPNRLQKGTYKVTEKKKVNYDKTLKWQLNRFIRFDGERGLHEIPINVATGERMHGEGILGTNKATSGGCIRNSVAMMDILWPNTAIGTPVIVL